MLKTSNKFNAEFLRLLQYYSVPVTVLHKFFYHHLPIQASKVQI